MSHDSLILTIRKGNTPIAGPPVEGFCAQSAAFPNIPLATPAGMWVFMCPCRQMSHARTWRVAACMLCALLLTCGAAAQELSDDPDLLAVGQGGSADDFKGEEAVEYMHQTSGWVVWGKWLGGVGEVVGWCGGSGFLLQAARSICICHSLEMDAASPWPSHGLSSSIVPKYIHILYHIPYI